MKRRRDPSSVTPQFDLAQKKDHIAYLKHCSLIHFLLFINKTVWCYFERYRINNDIKYNNKVFHNLQKWVGMEILKTIAITLNTVKERINLRSLLNLIDGYYSTDMFTYDSAFEIIFGTIRCYKYCNFCKGCELSMDIQETSDFFKKKETL